MKHKETKYELPENSQPSMACESPAAVQQYAEDLRYGMKVLNTVSPEELHRIVINLADYVQDDVMTMDEINSRIDEAERELATGEVVPGEIVHQKMREYINSQNIFLRNRYTDYITY